MLFQLTLPAASCNRHRARLARCHVLIYVPTAPRPMPFALWQTSQPQHTTSFRRRLESHEVTILGPIWPGVAVSGQ